MRFLPVAILDATSKKSEKCESCRGHLYHRLGPKSARILDFLGFCEKINLEDSVPARLSWGIKVGRGERIRTSDLSVPNRAHYQAVLRPEIISWDRLSRQRMRHSSGRRKKRSSFAGKSGSRPS